MVAFSVTTGQRHSSARLRQGNQLRTLDFDSAYMLKIQVEGRLNFLDLRNLVPSLTLLVE